MSSLKNIFIKADYQKIINQFQLIQPYSPSNWEHNFYIGASYYFLKKFQNSLDVLLGLNQIIENHEIKNFIAKNYQSLRQNDKAISYYSNAIKINPKVANYYNELANIYSENLKIDLAVQYYQKVLELDQRSNTKMIIYINIGLALYRAGKIEDAMISFKESLKINPNIPNAWLNLGLCYQQKREHVLAKENFLKAIELDPKFFYAYSSLGNTCLDLGECEKAIFYLQKALEINSTHSLSWMFLGKAYLMSRQHQLSLEASKKSFTLDPKNLSAVSNYLYSLNYLNLSDHEIYQEHQKYSYLFYDEKNLNPKNRPPSIDKKINIAFVSGDFQNHSVFYFFKSIIDYYNQNEFEIYCLSTRAFSDSITDYIKSKTQFVEVHSMSDEEVIKIIHDKNIHILVDLSGHTSGNRLTLFAKKPCLIQISWMGYPNNTGLKSIDYRIVDTFTDPLENNLGENKLKLKNFFMSYSPLKEYKILPPPCLKNQYVTFGSFNNIYKLTNDVIHSWSKILLSNSQNKLLLKYKGFGDKFITNNIISEFEKMGVAEEQLIFHSKVSNDEHFDMYNQIDIALDTFPYNGTTTSCEALWMGKPVITFQGDSHRSRVTHSILNNVKLAELSGLNKEQYIDIAIKLSEDFKKISNYTNFIRDNLKNSPLLDGYSFTKEVEGVFKNLISNEND